MGVGYIGIRCSGVPVRQGGRLKVVTLGDAERQRTAMEIKHERETIV